MLFNYVVFDLIQQDNCKFNGVKLIKVVQYCEEGTHNTETIAYGIEEKEEESETVGVTSVFRFSTSFDILLITIGRSGAVVVSRAYSCLLCLLVVLLMLSPNTI